MVLVPVSVPTFEKVMVPVPAPYLYHKKQIFLKKFVSFLHSKLFYKEKIINNNKFIVKFERKNVK